MSEFSFFHWLIVGVVVYFIYSVMRSKPNASVGRTTQGSAQSSILNSNIDWLRSRWSDADRESASGNISNFPKWYFDQVTERQLARLKNEGLLVSDVQLTKGKASDLIGLTEPLDEEHESILKFFKVPIRGMNQSRGLYEVGKLLADHKNLDAWNLRPAEPLQKEFFRFFGIKMPKDLTYVDAEKMMDEHREKLSEEAPQKLEEWESFESIIMDFEDKEVRDDWNVKKPSLSMLRIAIDELRKEGNSMEDLASDLSMVAEKLIEMKPELEKP